MYDERNRLALLATHGWMALITGLLITAAGAPSPWVEFAGPDLDWALAVPVLVGGSLLLIGLHSGRRLAAEAFGMACLLAWDLVMTALFVGQIQRHEYAVYPIAIYGGLAALMSIHLRTLWRYLKESR